MKYVLVVLCLLINAACDDITSSKPDTSLENKVVVSTCNCLDRINWSDEAASVAALESCYNWILQKSDKTERACIDSMLYLSYIYLSDGPYQNIDRANTILSHAIDAMSKDCDGAHGTYDNFCYMLYFKEDEPIPERFDSLQDAMHIYHMSMPCVYAEMLIQNPKTIELIAPYFGSSRDAGIPVLCDPFDPYALIDLRSFGKLENYDALAGKYSHDPIEGTIRFGIYQGHYQDMINMLFFPEKTFAEDDMSDPYIMFYPLDGTPDAIKMSLKLFKADIQQHQDLVHAYNQMVENVTQHYIHFLHLSPDVAAKYAPVTVLSTIYNYIAY